MGSHCEALVQFLDHQFPKTFPRRQRLENVGLVGFERFPMFSLPSVSTDSFGILTESFLILINYE